MYDFYMENVYPCNGYNKLFLGFSGPSHTFLKFCQHPPTPLWYHTFFKVQKKTCWGVIGRLKKKCHLGWKLLDLCQNPPIFFVGKNVTWGVNSSFIYTFILLLILFIAFLSFLYLFSPLFSNFSFFSLNENVRWPFGQTPPPQSH